MVVSDNVLLAWHMNLTGSLNMFRDPRILNIEACDGFEQFLKFTQKSPLHGYKLVRAPKGIFGGKLRFLKNSRFQIGGLRQCASRMAYGPFGKLKHV